MRATNAFILMLLCILGIGLGASLKIYSVSAKPDIIDSPPISSWRGGTMIYIKVLGHSLMASGNQIYVGTLPCIIPSDGVSDTYIACETTDSGVNEDIDNLPVTIISGGASFTTGYPNSVYYRDYRTPYILEIFPASGLAYSNVNFYGYHRITNFGDGQRDMGDVSKILLGNDICNRFDMQPSQADYTWQTAFINCTQSHLMEAGNYNVTEQTVPGYAKKAAYIRRSSLKAGEYFEFTALPTVTTVNTHKGNKGGQSLSISGTGFSLNKNNNSVEVDGTPCKVSYSDEGNIQCILDAKNDTLSTKLTTNSSNQTNGFLSGAGIRYARYSYTASLDGLVTAVRTNNLTTLGQPLQVGFRTELREGDIYGSYYSQAWSGYFTAPATGDYSFIGTSDDQFSFYLATVPGSTELPASALISSNGYQQWNDFYMINRPNAAATATLQKDMSYYFEAYHINGPGRGHFRIQASVPNTDTSLSFQTYQVDEIFLNQTLQPEVVVYTMKGGSGTFNLRVYRPVSGKTAAYDVNTDVTYNCDAKTFRDALNKFDYFSSYAISVDKLIYTVDGNTTTNITLADRIEYTVTIKKLRPTDYVTKAFLYNAKTYNGTFIQPTTSLKQHSPLISGTFTLTVGGVTIDPYGNGTLNYDTSPSVIQEFMRNHIDGFQDVEVSWSYSYGCAYSCSRWIKYKNYNNQTIVVPITAGLTGGAGLPTILVNTKRNYSSNVLFNPIDYRFLSIPSNTPNVIVKTNGIPSICTGDCSYSFALYSEVTSLSLSGTVLSFAISDPTLKILTANDVKVTVQGKTCTVDTNTPISALTCQLPVTGTGSLALVASSSVTPLVWVRDYGIAALASGVSPFVVPLMVNAPIVTGGTNGGYFISLTGKGFPTNPDDISITLCSAKAAINSTTSTQVDFYVPKCNTNGSQTITVKVGGITDTSQSFSYTDPVKAPTIMSISPTSANPGIKGIIEINGQGFGNDSSLLQVFLSNSSGKVYQLRVINSTITYIKAGLPGGLAGTFTVEVNLPSVGDSILAVNGSNTFKYQVTVQSVSPTQGSYYGGTLLNITGQNFATDPQQTLVFVGITVNWMCSIQSITTTNILCRTPAISEDYNPGDPQPIVVTTRLIVLSECVGSCNFTYLPATTSPALTNLTYNETLKAVTLEGTSFLYNSLCSISLTNTMTKAVTVLSPDSSTNILANLTIPSTLISGEYTVKVRNQLGESNGMSLKIKWVIFGSANIYWSGLAGARVTISGGSGYPLDLTNNQFSVEMKDPQGITTPANVASCSGNSIVLEMPPGLDNTTYKVYFNGPVNSVRYDYTSWGKYTGNLTLRSSSVVAPGLNNINLTLLQPFTNNIVSVAIVSVKSPLHTIPVNVAGVTKNGSSITFPVNLPAGSYKFKIRGAITYYSINDILNVSMPTNIYTSAQSYSYNGGFYTINASGLSPISNIRVNGLRGDIISYDTTTNIAIYQLPPLLTPQTQNNYSLAKPARLDLSTASLFSDITTNSNVWQSFDGSLSSFYSSTNSTCWIGVDFGPGLGASVGRIRFFSNFNWDNTVKMILGATFEGSNNGKTWTILATIDQTVHSGWNTLVSTISTPYRYVRYSHNSQSKCNIAEIELFGILFSTSVVDLNSQLSDVIYEDGYNTITLTPKITYSSAKTAIVTSFSPKYGDIKGGYPLTLTGINFFTPPTVFIDGVECTNATVDNTAGTTATCIVGARPKAPSKNSIVVKLGDNNAILRTTFYYVLKWSDKESWGVDLPPIDGDLVSVPAGTTLLVDQDTPNLKGIAVSNGTIIFSDDKDLTINTGFITLVGGRFIAGTEQAPHQHKLNFILHGDYYDTQMPMFGNKGIGCMECSFSMYGRPRTPTWTTISATINPGDLSFTVAQDVDWQVGEEIVVASTSFYHWEAERRRIVSVTANRTITVDSAFVYRHVYAIQTYGTSDRLPMIAEVGLLTRNIKMRGDDATTMVREYGSHLMIMGQSVNGAEGHIAFSEFTQCGQPAILGRYCIHFHMMGDVPTSYVRGNAVHDSLARVVTIHGVHYLLVENNVGYRVRGHNFFVEDGIETHNIIRNNLAIGSLVSSNMLQTDTSVASFWVTNPSNDFYGNHAAGSDFYGIWYQIKPEPDGPSATNDVCPIGNPLGSVHDNVAHSNIRFGLRIFKLQPRKYPCDPIRDDKNGTDPWYSNPSLPSQFSNFVLYKNMEDGLLAEQTGNVVFQNFSIGESYHSGVEFYLANFTRQAPQVINSFIVGQSRTNAAANKTNYTLGMSGAITGRSGVTKLTNIRFYSFPTGSILLQTCRLCDDKLKYTNMGTQVIVSQLTLTDINGSLLNMIGLQRDVVYDLDGSLSYAFDRKNRTSATIVHGFPHIALLNPVLCPQALSPADWDNAVMCGPTATLRRVYFTNLQNHQDFTTQLLKASELTDIRGSVPINLNQTNYTAVSSLLPGTSMQPKAELAYSWSLPFITGRIYNIWWGSGIDFTHVSVASSPSYAPAEKGIIFKFNYSENRERFKIGPMVGGAQLVQANYVSKSKNYLDPNTCMNGDYYHDNSDNTSLRMLNLCQSGKNKTLFEYTEVTGVVCEILCPLPPGTYVLESFLRYWSNATQWPGGVVPQPGDNVTVKGEWRLVLDMDPNPINNLTIDGLLIADDTMDINIIANFIYIRTGNFTAGSPTKPFLRKLNIQLNGAKKDTTQIIDPLLTGNKLFVVTGGLNLYGSPPSTVIATLTETAFKGSKQIKVDDYTDWKAGDAITLAPSFSLYSEYETATIQSIDSTTGQITLSAALQYTHYGAAGQTITSIYGNLDTRAKVGHISRNIKIFAGPDSGWGFSIYVYGYVDDLGVSHIGSAQLIGVQILDGGQLDSQNSPLVFKNLLASNRTSNVFGSSFVNCKAFCINVDTVTNVSITNNVLYNAWVFAVQAKAMKYFNFTSNVIIGVAGRPTIDPALQLVACYSTLTYVNATTDYVKVTDNFCQGSVGHGWAVPHVACNEIEINPFANNTIGSARIGFIVNTIMQECQAFSYVKAYACTIGHILGSPNSKTVLLSNFIVADNVRGLTLKLGASEGKNNHTAYLSNSYVTPISRPDCSYCYGGGKIDCTGVHGVRMFTASANGEVMPGKFGDGFDVICKQPVYDSKAYLNNVIFDNFKQSYNNTAVASTCGNNFVFRPNGAAFDMVGGHFLTNCNCTNCDKDSYVLCDAPDPIQLGWFGGCGDILCTGKNNYQVVDWTGGFLGAPGTIIGNNSVIGDNEANCTFSKSMNGHICKRTDFATLQYQSIAPDFNKRIMWPVNLTYDGANYTTITNGWREWQWLGKQPQNMRFGRFVSVVRYFQTYNMSFSAVPPFNLQLQLQTRTPTGNNSNYIIVRIYYPLPNSLKVTVKNKVVKPGVLTDYNNAASLLNNLNRSQCGSNIYFYTNTTIEFVLTEDPDCTAVISVVDSISLTTHFAVDINTFFTSNAITSFINNLCAILKITDTSRVKVVGVYSGSTVVNAIIEAQSTTSNTTVSNSSTTSNASSLTEINNLLNSNINSGVFASTMSTIGTVQTVVASVNYINNGNNQDQGSQKKKALIIGVSIGGTVVVAVISIAVMHVLRKRAKVMDDLPNEDQMHNQKQNNSDLYEKSAYPHHSEAIMVNDRSPAFDVKHMD